MRTFIRLATLKAMIGVSATSTIYDLMAAGRLPRPIKLSPRVAVWDKAEIEKWMDEAAATAKTAA